MNDDNDSNMESYDDFREVKHCLEQVKVGLQYAQDRASEALDKFNKLNEYDNPLANTNLSSNAKDLYKTFLLLTTPRNRRVISNIPVATIAKRSKLYSRAYYKALNELKRFGYVQAIQSNNYHKGETDKYILLKEKE